MEPTSDASVETPPDETVSEPLGREIDEYLSGKDYTGTVLIVKGEDIILRKAYGLADAEKDTANTINTPFHLASVTKQFTGAAILTLEAEGKLSNTDTLDKFFPGYESLDKVTVADLLAMKGGFRDFIFDFYSKWITDHTGEQVCEWEQFTDDLIDEAGVAEKAASLSLEEIETLILTKWRGEPLGGYEYSNSDYFLLGRIIERVSGMTYQEYVKEKLLTPAGMTNTGFAGTHDSATPHYPDGTVMVQKWAYTYDFMYSAGGIISAADDMSLWLDAYFKGTLFQQSALEKVSGGHNYNYGWHIEEDTRWFHKGGVPGFNIFVMYDRDSDTKIILLSNRAPGVAEYDDFGGLIDNVSSMAIGKTPY